ncbi:MAG: IucA/IucC family protein [Bdellovibrionota bacterium]
MHTHSEALLHSARAFFNSLLREWPYEVQGNHFVIENGKFRIPFIKFSPTGNHDYDPQFDFMGFVDSFVGLGIFRDRILASIENLSVSLSAFDRSTVHDFLSSEKGLLLGHPFHPHPKSRDEFSDDDFLKYAPETSSGFPLEWHLVRAEVIKATPEYVSELWKMLQQDFVMPEESGWIPYPAHPWQMKALKEKGTLRNLETEGAIRFIGHTKKNWHPTSSLRTLYQKESPFMLKFSLSVRITNSIRHLLPREVVRGLEVKEVLSTDMGKKLKAEHPSFNVMLEPAWLGIKNTAGEVLPETIVVLRENPFQSDSENTFVLGTLFQDNEPAMKKLMAGKTSAEVQSWFRKFLDIAILPLLRAQSDYGVLFGAHQQNLVVKLGDFLPEKAWFRDCQGTGYSPLGLTNFGGKVSGLTKDSANVLPYEYGLHLFCYYLIVNTTFGAIQSLSKVSGIEEKEFLILLRDFLVKEKNRSPEDSRLLDHLLNSPVIRQKGNFRCSFTNMNENMTDDPLAIYNEIPNPLRSL